MPSLWLYRVGRGAATNDGHRVIVSETFVSTNTVPNDNFAAATLQIHAIALGTPFGSTTHPAYSPLFPFVERLFPVQQMLSGATSSKTVLPYALNPNAPEASYRLQRVGAGGIGSMELGRLLYPVPSDAWFTDLPHRRHVNVAALAPLVAANINGFPRVYVGATQTFTNVIFHRRTFTWTPVDHYRILVNPVRRWQRWRTYDWAHRHVDDAKWTPPEVR